ncbi:hypothetical protein [Rariglobus hedericola]|uniref:Chromosome partition protein Smc n=1 Tax=Rariglobus hedericola TaxID=2597822 RepID=A0A556QMQ4_9BACT|nr:hypothetical protein [Rariglobus hedericola]TSJ77915.1 hypothetical protein FPL22_00980 [Rariglobus hedericola]
MKSLTLALCVIAILGSAASTFFYFQIGNTKEQLQQEVSNAKTETTQLQGKLTESSAQGEALQKRLAALDSDLGEAKSKTTAAESRNTQLSRDVSQLRNQLTAKTDAEQSLNGEISQLKRELAQAKLSASAATPEEIEAYKSKIETLEARVKEFDAGRSNTTGSMANTTGGTASGNTAGAPVADLSAEVVSIGAQNAFVVLNAGSTQGVQTGQHFAIIRSGATVATSQVSSVQENFSIAQINAGSINGGLAKGDTAKLTK